MTGNLFFRSVVVIGGATASGKSALALTLAGHLARGRRRGVVINADALQLYRDLRILSARPGAADEAQVSHRLYGVLDGTERGSVARWMGMARAEVSAALADGAVPIVVGGTGMYLRALMCGLAVVPDIPPDVRAWVVHRHEVLGGVAFRDELAMLDDESAAVLPAGDTQRLVRAYEVVKATGRTLPSWQRDVTDAPPVDWRFVPFIVEPPRDVLYRNCDARVEGMLERGVLEEVKTLVARGLDSGLPVMKAVGVPEFSACLRGEISLLAACAKVQQATRHYAKRQMTWFRNQMADARRVVLAESRHAEELQFWAEKIAGAYEDGE